MPSSSSSTITTFSEGLFSSMKARFLENKTRQVKQINICEHGLLDFISYIFVPFSSVQKKIVMKVN